LNESHTETTPAAEAREATWRVPLADIDVDDELITAVTEACASGWWSAGPRVIDFERRFADYVGTRHAIAVSSGTAALHLALLAVECGPGDEVVLPSLNFVACANAVVHTGARPVFCDIAGSVDLNLDPDDLAGAVGPATKAIVALHYGGYPCAIERVVEIAREHGAAVIEDAAHALGAGVNGRACGTFGEIGCFSFFSNKNLPVGEGGMLATDDDALAERLRLLRSHGMTTLTWDRTVGHAPGYDVLLPGFNYRLDEIRAAIASVQLGRLDGYNAARRSIVSRYREELDGVKGLRLAFTPGQAEESAHHLAVALLPEGADRDLVRASMRRDGVQSSVHYPPIHGFTAYAGDRSRRPLPRTDSAAGRLVTLPLFPHMNDDQIALVIGSTLSAL
jgi:dTDP-4-amino-4,6-dideoxygalactose transaminase